MAIKITDNPFLDSPSEPDSFASTVTVPMESEDTKALYLENDAGHRLLEGPLGRCMGMQVYIEPPPPAKLKLSQSVTVSSKFRQEFDDWLLAMFGSREPLLKPNEAFVSEKFGFAVIPAEASCEFKTASVEIKDGS